MLKGGGSFAGSMTERPRPGQEFKTHDVQITSISGGDDFKGGKGGVSGYMSNQIAIREERPSSTKSFKQFSENTLGLGASLPKIIMQN